MKIPGHLTTIQDQAGTKLDLLSDSNLIPILFLSKCPGTPERF